MGATGFLLVALPILMLGMGGVELTHGLFVRQALSHALMEAGRAATVDHADPDTLAYAFERALGPLFLADGSLPRALAQRVRRTGQAPWRIRIIRPRRGAFVDHADPGLRIPGRPPGRRAVNHDYQRLQHQRLIEQGWVQGRGPTSGETIFQANTLELELIWPHEPLVPGIKALMRALSPADDRYRSRLMANGYLPILRGVTLAMQSHPIDWPDRGDGKVVHGEADRPTGSAPLTCTGMWSGCEPASLIADSPGRQADPAFENVGGVGNGHTHLDMGGGMDPPPGAIEAGAGDEVHPTGDAPIGTEDPMSGCGTATCCGIS
jgi:hypothetical protein